jgi:HJR/Mrr/RecB family endonuclease
LPISKATLRKRRKEKAYRIARRKGKTSYRKGKEFEKKAYSFLSTKGYHPHRSRIRFKGGELDGIAEKNGRHYAVEAKNTRQKTSVAVVRRLKKKVAKSAGIVKGGIIVSRSGFTKEALAEKSKNMVLLKYKQKRKTSDWGWF